MSCPQFDIVSNCTDSGYPTEFDADPDVAGIGAILAFLLSSWATFLFVIITFLLVDSLDEGRGHKNNILDARVVERAKEFKENWLQPLVPQLLTADRPLSFGAIVNIAFASSDQQLMTGMSIFITGFVRHCIITQYHFYVVYLLGVISFSTHQSTMMIVGKELRECHWKRWWRLAVIFLVFTFSFTANIVVNNSYFLAEFGLVMQCVWSKFPHYYTSEEIGITTLTCSFLPWGFIAIIRDVCPDMNDLISLKFLLVCFTIIQIFSSQIVDLCRIWATLFYATYNVAIIREQAAHATTVEGNPALKGNENTWGFGQILPLLLLMLPGTQVWEMIWNELEDRRKDKGKEASSIPNTCFINNPTKDGCICTRDIACTDERCGRGRPRNVDNVNLETGTGNANRDRKLGIPRE